MSISSGTPKDPSSISSDTPYWLALLHTPGIGRSRINALLREFSTPKKLFESPSDIEKLSYLPAKSKRFLQNPNWDVIKPSLAWLEQAHCQLISLSDSAYPALLAQIPDPPPVLFVQGKLETLSLPQLAIVGSRNPSRHGYETAFAFAKHLADAGFVITSGMAMGVDAAGHKGALSGNGQTIAVSGCGLDTTYPKHHKHLASQICQRGALVSEYPPGTQPLPHQFPQRNRIISGLSVGTLVVEAALKSGSLITARLALEQGREVFAIPGSIHNPLAKGCHHLIKQGAKLVENCTDIWEEIGSLINSISETTGLLPGSNRISDLASNDRYNPLENNAIGTTNLTAEQALVLHNLAYEPTAIDVLVNRCDLTAETISSILVELEIYGSVVSTGGLYSRVHNQGI